MRVCKKIHADIWPAGKFCRMLASAGLLLVVSAAPGPAQAKDTKKAETLSQKADDLEKQLGPEYRALFDALNDADPNLFDQLDDVCGH